MDSTCGEGPVLPDPCSGALVCTSCGAEEHRTALAFTHSIVHHTLNLAAVITSTAVHLGLSPARTDEALGMAESATAGNFAAPTFLPTLAAACAFLVARSHRLPLSLAEAAEAAPSCTAAALADLSARVAARLALLPLPPFNYSAALERAVSCSYPLSTSGETEAILSHARFLFRCASRWSLAAGWRPLPLIAAAIALAAELNGVTHVSAEDVARDMWAAVPARTTRRRYDELVDTLVRAARELLPWDADVHAGNLLRDAPMLLRLIQSDPSDQFLESFTPDPAGTVQSADEIVPPDVDADDLDLKNTVFKRLSQLKELAEAGKAASRRKRWRAWLELEPWMDTLDEGGGWTRLEEEVADAGVPPPSFTAGLLLELQKHRRARIEAAKRRRIDAPDSGKKKRKRSGPCCDGVAIDWEDCVIELLLLHGANEAELEQGQYRRLLESHVFGAVSGYR